MARFGIAFEVCHPTTFTDCFRCSDNLRCNEPIACRDGHRLTTSLYNQGEAHAITFQNQRCVLPVCIDDVRRGLRRNPQFADCEHRSDVRERNSTGKTYFLLQLASALNSANLTSGQTLSLEVADDVYLDGAIVIPHGAPAVARVTEIKGKGAFGKAAQLSIDMVSITVDGHTFAISGHSVHYSDSGLHKLGMVVGIAGPLGGMLVSGSDVLLGRDRRFPAFTEQPIPVLVPHKPPEIDQTPEMFRVDAASLAPVPK